MQTLNLKSLWNHKWNFARNRKRAIITALAITGLLVTVALAAVNANATPRNPVEMQVAGWVNELKSDNLTAARQEAQRNLELAGDAAVPQLITALHSNNVAERRNAADMLSFIASPKATDALLNSLRTDAVPAVRRNAAYALGEIKPAAAINALQQASITDRSETVRGAAADSLARIRTALALKTGVNEQWIGGYASAPSQADTLYLAAKRDLQVSRDGGNTWKTLTDALPSQISALAVDPTNPQKLYAGVEGAGMFKSTDGGKTWQAVNNGIELTPGARESISAIAIDPENANLIYVSRGLWLGTGKVDFYPVGLLASHDGGSTWTTLSTDSTAASADGIAKLAFNDGQLYGLAGNRVLTLVTPQ